MVDIHPGLAGIEGQGPRKILQHQDPPFHMLAKATITQRL
jgi:hypothetical protein